MKKNRNDRKVSITLILVLLLIIIANIIGLRKNIVEEQLSLKDTDMDIIKNLISTNDDNPESTKYLVTDKNISRVAPNTTIEEFKKNINSNITVYEDEALTKEVVSGYIKSNMFVKYLDNNRVFKLSVVGDLDNDGILNQIELTKIIRYIVDEKYKIFDEIGLLSSDVNFDGIINKEDINIIIKYIVFGNLDIPEVKQVQSPNLTVISGKQENDVYVSNVRVQVNQVEQNALKTVYRIISKDGSTEYKQAQKDDVITIRDDGIYKIQAYTYGILGNKSKSSDLIIIKDEESKIIPLPDVTITHTPLEWTKNNVECTITNNTALESDMTLEYCIVDFDENIVQEYKKYEMPFEVDRNSKVKVRLTDGKKTGGEVEHDITNIDKVLPVVANVEASNVTTNSITLNIKGKDEESGISKIRLYVNDELKKTYEYTGNSTEEKHEEYKLTALPQNTEYRVYIEVEDAALNVKSTKADEKIVKTDILDNVDLSIQHTPLNWTKDNVLVTINTNNSMEEGYVTQYRVLNSKGNIVKNWTNYIDPFEVEQNGQVVAMITDSITCSNQVSHDISNIDKISPVIASVEASNITSRSFDLNIKGKDEESGISKIRLYVDSKLKHTYEYTGNDTTQKIETYKLDELKPGTKYQVYIEVEDTVGNIKTTSDNILNVVTDKLPDEYEAINIDSTPKTWTKENVNVSISKTEDMKENVYIEYSICDINNNILENYKKYTQAFDVDKNCIVKARLTDGINVSEEKLYNIQNIDKTLPSLVNINAIDIKSDRITLDIDAQDNESGIKTIKVYVLKADDYVVYTKEFSYNGNEVGHENKDIRHENLEITNLDQNTSYKYYMEVYDQALNLVTTTKTNISTVEVPNISASITWTPTDWTNQEVNVTITEDEHYDGYNIEYSVDNISGNNIIPWTEYTNNFTVSENCIVKARLTDNTNSSNIISAQIKNIDKAYPTANITESDIKTNGFLLKLSSSDTQSGVKLVKLYVAKKGYKDTIFTKEYTYNVNLVDDAKSVTHNEDLVISNLDKNTTYVVYMDVIDGATNKMTTSKEKEITTKDMPVLDASITHTPEVWTKNNVSVEINENNPSDEYTLQFRVEDNLGNEIEDYDTYIGEFTVSQNCIVRARLTDGLNYSNEIVHYINNIDTVEPSKANISVDNESLKMNSFTLNVEGEDENSGLKEIRVYVKKQEEDEYKLTKHEYEGNPVGKEKADLQTFKVNIENATPNTIYEYYVEVEDQALNVKSTNKETLTTKEFPTLNATITHNPTDWTNQDVDVNIKVNNNEIPDGIEVWYQVVDTDLQVLQDYTKYKNTFKVGKNATVYAKFTDLNESSNEISHNIENIDKEPPVITKADVTEDEQNEKSITLKATDNNGIIGYGISKNIDTEPDYTPCESLKSLDTTISVNNNGTYYVFVKDVAKNITKKMVEVKDLSKDAVAKIGDKLFPTLREAIDYCEKNATDTATTIEMLKDVDEVNLVEEGKNIIIDLKGHTVGSSDETQPTLTNNGKLQIVDTSEEKTGKVESKNATAIKNNESGVLRAGNNDTQVSNECPVIQGKNIGVDNSGFFGFYDGKIIGKIAINGDVNKTPDLYNAMIETDETDVETATLGILADVEAKIGNKYYIKLAEAIENVKSDDTPTIVTVLKAISLTNTLVIPENKNIILDLNGNLITITSNSHLIDNHGKLEIIDKNSETGNVGSIENKNSITIYSYSNSVLEIKGGILKSTNESVIVSQENSDINISGGEIITSKVSNSAILSNGSLNITGGKITGQNFCVTIKGTEKSYISGGSFTLTYPYSSSANTYNFVDNYSELEITGVEFTKGNVKNEDSGNLLISGSTIASISNSGNIELQNTIVNETIINYSKATIYSSTCTSITNSGNLEMTNGSIISKNTAVINSSIIKLNENEITGLVDNTGTCEINNCYVKSIGTISSTIRNGNSGNITINDSNIIYNNYYSSSSAILNNGVGSITITRTNKEKMITISNNKEDVAGIWNASTGTINIGIKSDNIESQESYPIISSSYYGIRNEKGTVNFYEGSIIADNEAVSGTITNIPDNSYLNLSNNNSKQVLTIVDKTEKIVKVNDSQEFMSIEEAVDSCNENENKITVLRDFVAFSSENILQVPENKNITLDLNSHTITTYMQDNFITNNGNLTIKDDSVEKSGKILNGVIQNEENGNLNLENCEIISTKLGKSASDIKYILNNLGTTNINDLTLQTSKEYSYAINNLNQGKINMTSGQIDILGNNTYAIQNTSSNSESIKITGGTINSKQGIINNDGTGNVEISNVTLTSGTHFINNIKTGNIEIKNTNVTSSSDTIIENTGGGNINIIDSSLKGSNEVIKNTSGNILIEGIDSNSTVNGSSNVINNNDIIQLKNKVIIEGNNITNKGTFTIGDDTDNSVSEEYPIINGIYSGNIATINNSCIINFYDGIVTSKNGVTFSGGTTSVVNTPKNYEVEKTHNGKEEIAKLKLTSAVASIGDTEYMSIKEALDACETNKNTTIKILRNLDIISKDEKITVDENKDVIIDLNSNTIKGNMDCLFENKGKLQITDNSLEKLGNINAPNKAINNYGNLLTVSNIKIETKGDAITNLSDNCNININNKTIINSTGYCINNCNAGNIKLEDSTLTSTGYYVIVNSGRGTIYIDGANITNTVDKYSISNGTINNQCKVIINSGQINGNIEGRFNSIIEVNGGNIIGNFPNHSGSLKITGGHITGYISIYDGDIQVGSKDGNPNDDIIIDAGKNTCIQNSANTKLKYYGGTLKGKTAIDISVEDIEEGYHIDIENNEETEIATLKQKIDAVQIDGKEEKFSSIKEAMESLTDNNATIKLIKDKIIVAGNENSAIIPENKNIILDFNGKRIIHSNNNLIENNGNLEIKDSVSSNIVNIFSYSVYAINNKNGVVTLSSGIIDGYNKEDIYNSKNYISGVLNNEGATVNLKDIILCGIYNQGNLNISDNATIDDAVINSNQINMSSGTIKGALINKESKQINITGGNINANVENYGQIELSNATVTSDIKNNKQSKLTIQSGNIKSRIFGNDEAHIIINGGDIKELISSYKLDMTGGTIERLENNNNSNAIISDGNITSIMNRGILNISNVTINADTSFAIENLGTLKITGGNIVSKNNVAIKNTKMLTIGNDDDNEVNTTTPYIEGKSYGVDNTSTFNFYDGEINGEISIGGTVNQVPEGYEVVRSKTEKIEKAILKPIATDDAVAKVGTIYYKTIQEAINSKYLRDTKTIEILRDTEVSESLNIDSNKNIIIDLQSHTISANMSNYIIINDGTLTILDTIKGGHITNQSGPCILNNTTLNIGLDDKKEENDMLTITGTTVSIGGNGTVNRYDGIITNGIN